MNKTEAIETINRAAEKRDNINELDAKNQSDVFNEYQKQIKALAPRIKDMLDIAREMWLKRIPIGDKEPCIIGCLSSLFTDGIDHRLGFFANRSREWRALDLRTAYPYNFGIEGGGYAGCGLEIDEDGNVIRGGVGKWYEPQLGKIRSLLTNFDKFEQSFYNYINSL